MPQYRRQNLRGARSRSRRSEHVETKAVYNRRVTRIKNPDNGYRNESEGSRNGDRQTEVDRQGIASDRKADAPRKFARIARPHGRGVVEYSEKRLRHKRSRDRNSGVVQRLRKVERTRPHYN